MEHAVIAAARRKRQFVFERGAGLALPGWRKVGLPAGWTLHLHPGAPVEILSADPAAPVLRIGQAFCLDARGEAGAGRYALLRWPELAPDAGALLALHHGARPGREVVSSSAALAAEALDGRPLPLEGAAPLAHRSMINYLPMPGAPFAGLARLLHDQTLDLAAFRLRPRPPPVARLGSYDEALAALAGELLRFAEELKSRVAGRVFLPLTAGLDSRTLLAAFLATGLPFETVTLDYCGKPRTDVTVARAISRRFGLSHRTIALGPHDPAAAALLDGHVAGAALDWDHTHIFPRGGYRYLAPGDVVVKAACFEIARQRAAETCFEGLDFATATGAEVWRRRTGDAFAPPDFARFLDDWIAWRRAHPLDMDFAAAFYLDQRLGGWRSTLELGYDLLAGVSICPANSARVYSALLTPAPAEQRAGRLQKDLIALLAPGLLGFPLNPPGRRVRAAAYAEALLAAARARLPGRLLGRRAAAPRPRRGDLPSDG